MYVSITRTWYNKRNNSWWKLYVLNSEIIDYLDLKNNDNYNIVVKNNLKEEISIEDIPF